MFVLARLARLVLFYLLDSLAAAVPARRAAGGVLLVRLDAIGDFVLWLDAALVYRQLYPDRRIVLCANSAWADLARCLPWWDEVLAIDVRRLSTISGYRFAMLRQIRQRGFDIAIQPVHSRVFLHGDAVIRASHAAQRLGSTGDLSNIHPWLRALADRWYTRLLRTSAQSMPELERNAEFAGGLAGRPLRAAMPRLERTSALPERLRVAAPYLVVFPGAAWSGRRWPAEAFVALLEQVYGKHGLLPVLCGSRDDRALCQAILDRAAVAGLNFSGETTLPELAELIRHAKLLVANETSAVHLAAAVGTPAVCIVGGGHYGRFMPYPGSVEGVRPITVHLPMPCYGCGWRCTEAHPQNGAVPCISGVLVEQTDLAIAQALKT